jgi:hypothetical protein
MEKGDIIRGNFYGIRIDFSRHSTQRPINQDFRKDFFKKIK